MKKLLLSVVVSFCLSSFAEVQKFEKLDDFEKTERLTLQNEVFKLSGSGRFLSNEFIYIDPAATYTLSLSARKVAGSPDFFAHIGFILYDESMVELKPFYYRAEDKSESVLVKDVLKGDKSVVIKLPSRFPKDLVRRAWHIAFDIRKDKSDIPNRTVRAVTNYEILGDDSVKLTLSSAVDHDYSAGTATRFHSSGPIMYSLLNGAPLLDQWQSFSAKVKGVCSGQSMTQFWKGAAFFKIIISNTPSTSDHNLSLEFKDVSLIKE